MGYYKTKNCFFTNNEVISCDETDDSCLDGYYYRVRYNDTAREVRLIWDYDWQQDEWMNKNGKQFFQLLEQSDNWNVFDHAKDIDELKVIFEKLS